jgi:methyltransferase family protein
MSMRIQEKEKTSKTSKDKIRKRKSRSVKMTPEMWEIIQESYLAGNFTPDLLSEASGLGISKTKEILRESSCDTSYDRNTYRKIAEILQIDLADLLTGKSSQRIPENISTDFRSLCSTASEIDEGLMRAIRSMSISEDDIGEAYNDLLRFRCQKNRMPLDSLLNKLKDRTFLGRLRETVPSPDIVIDVDRDFKRIVFDIGDKRTLINARPALLWDCHKIPGIGHRNISCRIHKEKYGDEIEEQFNEGHALICYAGLKFLWNNRSGVWPPSVDAFAMIEDLEKNDLFDQSFDSVLDIGSGTGFLGICMTKFNKRIKRLDMTDWLLAPAIYSALNWEINCVDRHDVDVNTHIGLFTDCKKTSHTPYDVVLCNPPYLPVLEKFRKIRYETTIAGIDLLKHVIRRSDSLGRHVYIQFSHLVYPEARKVAEAAEVELKPVGRERKVPFRLKALWEHSDYLDVLINELGLIKEEKDRYMYWHKIRTYKIV